MHRLQRALSSNPIQPQNVISSLGRLSGAIHVSAPAKAQSLSKGCSWPGSQTRVYCQESNGAPGACRESWLSKPSTWLLQDRDTALPRIPVPGCGLGGWPATAKPPRLAPACIPGLAQPSWLPKPVNSQGETRQSSRQLLDHHCQHCPPLISNGRIFCFSLASQQLEGWCTLVWI